MRKSGSYKEDDIKKSSDVVHGTFLLVDFHCFFLNISHFLISGSWLFLCAGRTNLGHPAFRSASAALIRELVEAPVTARARRDLSPGVGVLLNAQRPGEPFGIRLHQVPPVLEVYTTLAPVASSLAF